MVVLLSWEWGYVRRVSNVEAAKINLGRGLVNGLWSLAYQLSEREVTAGWSPSEEWNISYRWGLEPI